MLISFDNIHFKARTRKEIPKHSHIFQVKLNANAKNKTPKHVKPKIMAYAAIYPSVFPISSARLMFIFSSKHDFLWLTMQALA